MQQMKINEDQKVCIDLDDPEVPQTVRILKPVVYKEDNSYCCLLGPDPQNGVFSTGDTPLEAIRNWAGNLEARVSDCGLHKETADYIRAVLNNSKEV